MQSALTLEDIFALGAAPITTELTGESIAFTVNVCTIILTTGKEKERWDQDDRGWAGGVRLCGNRIDLGYQSSGVIDMHMYNVGTR